MALFALSYDPVDVLARFAERHGITFDLLSDPGSVTIGRLRLLADPAALEAQHRRYGIETDERHAGLPHPATIMVDADGRVRECVVEPSYRLRPGAAALLRRSAGTTAAPADRRTIESHPVTVHAWLASDTFRALQAEELYVRLDVADGWHVYVDPVPEGLTGVQVRLAPRDDLDAGAVTLEHGTPARLRWGEEEAPAVGGEVLAAVPYRLAGRELLLDGRRSATGGGHATVTLEVQVRYQACSDTECLPPVTVSLPFTVREVDRVARD